MSDVIRNEFAPSPIILLNSGSVSRCPKSVLAAVHRYVDEFEVNPTRALFETWPRLWSVQKKVANFFNARPQDLFLRPNVTCAMNEFLLGVDLPAQGSIIISDLEYGAIVNVCQMRAERDGRDLHTITLRAGAESYANEDAIVADVLKQIPSDAAMIMLSHVMTGTGLVMPLKRLGEEFRKRGILFAVDGAHGPGALPLDFSDLATVDFYGGNLHKWFMGPKGTGFGWAHESVQHKMQPISGGWTTGEPLPHFKRFADGDPFALRFLLAHTNNVSPYYGLSEAVDFWRAHGEDAIRSRIYDLQAHAANEMDRIFGWRLISSENRDLRGPLVAYEMPEKVQSKGFDLVFDMLESQGVQLMMPTVKGRLVLRLSPHVYNSESEVTEGLTRFKNHLVKNALI